MPKANNPKNTTPYSRDANYNPPAPLTLITVSTTIFEEMGEDGDVKTQMKALLDTGADISFIPARVINDLEEKLGIEIDCSVQKVRDFNGSYSRQRQVHLRLSTESVFLGDGAIHKFLVLEDCDDGIIGRDILNSHSILFDRENWTYKRRTK